MWWKRCHWQSNKPLLNTLIYMFLNWDCKKQMSNEALLKYDAVLRLNKSCPTPEVCMIKTHGGTRKGIKRNIAQWSNQYSSVPNMRACTGDLFWPNLYPARLFIFLDFFEAFLKSICWKLRKEQWFGLKQSTFKKKEEILQIWWVNKVYYEWNYKFSPCTHF